MDITAGCIVSSENGRDKGKRFFVIQTGNGYAEIANGKERLIEKTKHKKLKHLRFEGDCVCQTTERIRNGEKVTNNELRKALAAYAADKSGDNGGMYSWQKTM